jgi:hypothetical protein
MLNTLASVALQCVIVWSPGTNGNASEKFWHEQAHCWGWSHPTKASTFGAAYKVPSRYRLKGEFPGWISPCGKSACTVQKAKSLCNGHFGCQWAQ